MFASRFLRALAVASTLVAWTAQAQPQRSPEPAATDESTAHFERGVAHLRAERYHEAVDAFRASYRVAPRVTTMCNLALSYDRWGPEHRENAARAYRTCATEDESGRFAEFARERVVAIERELVLDDDPSSQRAPTERAPDDSSSASPTREDGAHATTPPLEDDTPARTREAHARPFAWAGVAAGVLTAAAFATGVALALESRATRRQLEDEVGAGGLVIRGSDADRLLSRGESFARGARAAYAISGIAAAAAGLFVALDLVLARDRADTRSVSVTPRLGGAALRFDLRF